MDYTMNDGGHRIQGGMTGYSGGVEMDSPGWCLDCDVEDIECSAQIAYDDAQYEAWEAAREGK